MRIKEEIKRSGRFWIPSAPEKQVDGTLTISDGGRIELKVNRPFASDIRGIFNFNSEGLNRIVGHIEKDGLVTLESCVYRENKRSIYHGALYTSDLISVGRIFTGVQYDEDEIPRFNTLKFSVEGIDEWVAISGIEVDYHRLEEHSASILYERPTDVVLNLENDIQLLITFSWTPPGWPNAKEAKITQKTYFKLVSEDARELDEFISVAHRITEFLCFAINETVSLDSMSATSDDLTEDIGEDRTQPKSIKIYYQSWPYAENEPKINRNDMLFKFTDIRGDAERIIDDWIKAYEQIAPAFRLYFLAKLGSQTYLEEKFLTLAQGLETYHRGTSNEKVMNEAEFEGLVENLLNQCPEERKEWLERKLKHGNEVSLRKRIKRLDIIMI